MTRNKLFLALAGSLFLLFLLWAFSSVSIRRTAPDQPKLGITNEQLADIEERQSAPGSAVDYARLDERLQRLMESDSMVGLAVGVVENGEIRFLKGYGITAAGSTDPVGTDTVFRWASLSKGVAADMVALLAAENKLSLYEPVGKYSLSLRLPGGNEQKATVSDLLSHRLGLFAHANDPKLEADFDPKHLRSNLATLNAICSPGQCHAYQNVAYDAASEVVEKVTGRPYAEVVRERLFLPLGMSSATMTREGLMSAASWAKPHTGGRKSRPLEVAEAYYRVPAAGGVNSSIKDLAAWMQAQMGADPQVLPAAALQAVQSPRVRTPNQQRKFRERIPVANYGLGWRIYDFAGHRVIGHHGGVRGYRSLILFDPLLRSGVVALWNNSRTSQPNGIEIEVMDMIYRLPTRDWLGIDGDSRTPPVEEEPDNVQVDTGGTAR
ncbi:MAG TPA: serine hydrolase domain-containing protein [Allosphingosinicella sp.]